MSARLKFWGRSCDPNKGVGTRRFKFIRIARGFAGRGGSAAKSHSTSTQYRQLRRLPFTEHLPFMNKVRILLALLLKEFCFNVEKDKETY